MRNARQLREYIRRLESAAYGLRSEAMLRNSPHADSKVKIFDAVIEEGRQANLEAIRAAEQKRAAKLVEKPAPRSGGMQYCEECPNHMACAVSGCTGTEQ